MVFFIKNYTDFKNYFKENQKKFSLTLLYSSLPHHVLVRYWYILISDNGRNFFKSPCVCLRLIFYSNKQYFLIFVQLNYWLCLHSSLWSTRCGITSISKLRKATLIRHFWIFYSNTSGFILSKKSLSQNSLSLSLSHFQLGHLFASGSFLVFQLHNIQKSLPILPPDAPSNFSTVEQKFL